MTRSITLVAVASLVASTSVSAQAPADPWRQIPALPTSCLADEFRATVEQLHETAKAELAKQEEINDKLELQFNSMDMQEKMRRMQAFMAKNPQEAMKVMQAMQGAAGVTTTDITDADKANTELDAQFEELKSAFKAAVEASIKPVQAKQGQMIQAKAENYAGGHRFKSKADQDAFMELLTQEDAAYEKACAPFFGTGGKFHAWLDAYKTGVAMKVASGNDANQKTIATQMAMLDSPGAGYKTTGQLMGVRDYLGKIAMVYGLRSFNARPPQDLIIIK